eukprot:12672658-Prorocentrum_lima.AAC.1
MQQSVATQSIGQVSGVTEASRHEVERLVMGARQKGQQAQVNAEEGNSTMTRNIESPEQLQYNDQ